MTFDPASLALTGWWRASYGGSPWAAVASAGSSGSNGTLAEAINAPSVGASLNGKASANFDGTNDRLANSHDLDTFFDEAAWSVSGVIAADTAASHNTNNGYLDEAIVTQDVNGFFYITFSTSGITAGHFDNVSFKEIVKACAADGNPHTFHAWYDGTSLHLTVDGSSATPVTAGNVFALAGNGALKLGTNYDNSAFYDGRVWDLIVADTDLGSTARTNIESYFQATYISSTSPIAAALTGSASSTALLKGAGALASAQSGSSSGTALLKGAGALASALSGTCTSGATGLRCLLATGLSGSATTQGVLLGSGVLASTQTGSATASGTVTGAGVLASSQSGTASMSGLLKGSGALSSTLAGTCTVSAAITGYGFMIAALVGTSTCTGLAEGIRINIIVRHTGAVVGSVHHRAATSASASQNAGVVPDLASSAAVVGMVRHTSAVVGSVRHTAVIEGTA